MHLLADHRITVPKKEVFKQELDDCNKGIEFEEVRALDSDTSSQDVKVMLGWM